MGGDFLRCVENQNLKPEVFVAFVNHKNAAVASLIDEIGDD